MNNFMICYRGSVEAWEMDHMGHMNVQFYLEKASHAVKVFFLKNDLVQEAKFHSSKTFTLKGSHIRFLKEQKAGNPLYIEVGLNALSKTSFGLTVIMKEQLTNSPAASFIFTYKIVDGKDKNQTHMCLEQAHQKFNFTVPDYAMPRGLTLPKNGITASVKHANKLKMKETFLGIASSQYVYMGPSNYMAIISNAVPSILAEALSKVDISQYGGAALEYIFSYQSFAKTGTLLSIRSGLERLEGKTFTWIHWIFNAKTGALICEARALVIAINLKKRKSTKIPKKMHDSLKKILINFPDANSMH